MNDWSKLSVDELNQQRTHLLDVAYRARRDRDVETGLALEDAVRQIEAELGRKGQPVTEATPDRRLPPQPDPAVTVLGVGPLPMQTPVPPEDEPRRAKMPAEAVADSAPPTDAAKALIAAAIKRNQPKGAA